MLILRKRMICLLSLFVLGVPMTVYAESGEVLFVYGGAHRVAPDGQRTPLNQGTLVETGDTITTSINGRVQIRMADGGLVALRPNTEFQIEAFVYAPQVDGSATAAAGEPKSFFVLLKGGFRSITGAVGKTNKSSYRVRTPVATIGIRGTDYNAQFCAADCDVSFPDGLSVSVRQGGVVLKNDAGSVDIDAGQSGFVADALTPPVQSTVASGNNIAAATKSTETSEDQEEEAVAPTVATMTEEGVDLTGGGDPVSGSVAVAVNQAGTVAAFSDVSVGEAAQLFVDANGNVTGLTTSVPNAGNTDFGIGSAQNINIGADPSTGLRWGRWANGSADVLFSDGTQDTLDLGDSSLHWIVGDVESEGPTLPTTGTATFSLVGNTNPTDNRGNVGVLGSANLSADFTNQTVNADLLLSIANETWDANAQDVALDGNAAEFSGDFDTVTIQDVSGTRDGTGSLAGFFTGDDAGNLDGAGLGFSLSDDSGVDVSGAAAFQVDPDGNP